MRLEQVGLCNLFVTMSWKKRSLWCPLNITSSTSIVSNLSHGVNTRTMIEQNVFQALLTIIYPTHCVINVTFFIPFWSPETTILLGCTEKSRLLTPLATPIFEQEQSACSAIFSPSELSDCMVSLFHGPLVWAEVSISLINVYKHQSKSYSSFNYNKDSILLLVTFQIHSLLKNKNLFEGVGEPHSNCTFSAPSLPTAQQSKPFVEKGYHAVIPFYWIR